MYNHNRHDAFEAAEQASHWVSIGDFLKQHVQSRDDPLVPFLFAFLYYYVEPFHEEIRLQRGPFAPFWEFANGATYPPPLESLPDEFLTAWENVVSETSHPVLASRLNDLLWVLKRGERPDLHARAAISAYIELSRGTWDGIYRTECLTRALELVREINDPVLQNGVIALLIESARSSMNEESPKPGVTLRLIKALLTLPRSQQPPEVDALLEQAKMVYGQDAHTMETILMLLIKRSATENERKALQREIVQKWIQFADGSKNGLIKHANYQHALELARNYGFSDLITEIRIHIQQSSHEIDWKEVSATLTLSADEVEKFVKRVVDVPDWRTALKRFGAYGPPSGDHVLNLKQVQQLKQRHPIQFLMTGIIFDANGFPIQIAASEDAHESVALSQHESWRIQAFGELFANEILESIRNLHGDISLQNLAEFFTTPSICESIAERVAQSIVEYWAGRYDESAHILVPRIEAIIRAIARETGIAIYREPQGNNPGGVVPLGTLLSAVKGIWDEPWRRYLLNLLVDPIGINLRNRIAHGLVDKVTKTEAALLIHAVCYLRLVRVSERDDTER